MLPLGGRVGEPVEDLGAGEVASDPVRGQAVPQLEGEAGKQLQLAVAPAADQAFGGGAAERLREEQRDDQSLPPDEVLDPILERYVAEDEFIDQIVASGFKPHRRRADREARRDRRVQAPPGAAGIKITVGAFGRDRRMPIVNRYRPLPPAPVAEELALLGVPNRMRHPSGTVAFSPARTGLQSPFMKTSSAPSITS